MVERFDVGAVGCVRPATGACLGQWVSFMYRDAEQHVAGLEDGLLVDGRNALDPGAAAAADLLYQGFGHG